MKNLKGKKLLLLGGIAHAMEIVKAAHEMGVEVYVTDYYETSPAKMIADKSFTVSTTDVDAVVELCQSEKIDGVITGFIDSMLPYCEKICRELDMPFWGTQEQIQICINKKLFKETCKKFDVPLAEEYYVRHDEFGNLICDNFDKIKYPVIVKPVDNSGSRGVYVCKNSEELFINYKKALKYSKSKIILVEQCIIGQHVNMYYTLIEGEAHLSAMADRYVDYLDGGSAPLPVCLVHPSQYLADYEETVDKKICNMFKELGMKNGVAFVQGFRCKDGSFKIYEMGYRLNGGATYSLIEACSGYNQLKMLINFSLTGKMGEIEQVKKTNAHFNKLAINFVLSVSEGNIKTISGLEYVQNLDNIVNVVQVRFEGEQIQGKGGSAQVIAYILFTVSDKKELTETLAKIYENVLIIDENGEKLEIIPFNLSEIME